VTRENKNFPSEHLLMTPLEGTETQKHQAILSSFWGSFSPKETGFQCGLPGLLRNENELSEKELSGSSCLHM
jgi:hypothetical protein